MQREVPVWPVGLFTLLILAGGLRIAGLQWGIPDASRFYPYHPDEASVLAAQCRVNPLWGEVAPGFYNYGSLTILAGRLTYDLVAPVTGWGPIPRFDKPFEEWVGDYGHMLLVGRILSVLFGTATVALMFFIGRRLGGDRAGLYAASFGAVAPIGVMLSHYNTVDVPAAFFSTLVLLMALRASERTGRAQVIAVLGAGFAAGLSAGAKYPGALSLLVLVPVLLPRKPEHGEVRTGGGLRRSTLLATGALLAAGAAFIVSTPGCLLQTNRFLGDLFYELGRNREGQGIVFRGTPPALFYHLLNSLPIGLEWPLYVLSLAGLSRLGSLRQRPALLVMLHLILLFLPLVLAERKFVRYVTPLIPHCCIAAGALLAELSVSRARWGSHLAVAAGFAGALASTSAHLNLITDIDVRDRVAGYLMGSTRLGQLVVFTSDPWFYTPPVHPTAGCVKISLPFGGPPIWDRRDPDESRPEEGRAGPLRVAFPNSLPPEGPMPVERLRRLQPTWILTTDYEYEDPERLRSLDPNYHDAMTELQDEIRRKYRLVQTFRPRPQLGPFTWWARGTPPHDWRYFMPTIRLYVRPAE